MKLAAVAVALLLGWVREAEACDDLHSHSEVVGVASDGRFVTQRWWLGGVDCRLDTIELRSAVGDVLATYESEPNSAQTCAAEWSVTGRPPLPAAANEAPDSLLARLRRELALQPLRSAPERLTVKQDYELTCLRVFLGTPDGALPIWSQMLSHYGDCSPVKVSAANSPRSELLFINYRYERLGTCNERAEGVHWLTRRELDASRHLLRAEKSFARAHYRAAARAAETALALAPDLVPARMLLARALARSGADWSLAQGRLTGSYLASSPCRDGAFVVYGNRFEDPEFEPWRNDDTFEPWLEGEYTRHREAHGTDESPLAGWDR